MQYDPSIHGEYLYEYNKQGILINRKKVLQILKKTGHIRVYGHEFKPEISEEGQLKEVGVAGKPQRGNKPSLFFVPTAKTEYDLAVAYTRWELINHVNTCKELDELKHIYASITTFTPKTNTTIQATNNKTVAEDAGK